MEKREFLKVEEDVNLDVGIFQDRGDLSLFKQWWCVCGFIGLPGLRRWIQEGRNSRQRRTRENLR